MTCREVRSPDFDLAAEIRHVLPVGLRPPKFQSVNPPSLRSIGIPKTPDREAESRIAVAPVDDWTAACSSTGTKHRRHWAKNSTSSRSTRHVEGAIVELR